MKNCLKHKIPAKQEEWLADRLKGIGGSDAGAILGLNPYKSQYALWCEKTGRMSKQVDNEAMRLGRDLEDYVALRFMEVTGKKVKKSNYSFQSKTRPFMLANVDRLIIGENAGLECKTTNMLTKTKYDKGDIPAQYYAQCVHYMAVTGAERWYIAVLVLGVGFHWFVVERDENEIAALIEAETEYWQHVVEDTEPPIDGYDSTTEAIAYMHPSDNGDAFELFGREELINKYMSLNKNRKELEKEIKECENILKNDLGDFEKAYAGNYTITWKTISSNRADSKALKENYPEIYERVLKQSTSRKFTIKENSNDNS